jgi:hypothetical protein
MRRVIYSSEDNPDVMIRGHGPLKIQEDISYRYRPPSAHRRGSRPDSASSVVMDTRVDVLEKHRQAERDHDVFGPGVEEVYFADGTICKLDSNQYAAELLNGVLPDSNIPARYHLHTETFLPKDDDAVAMVHAIGYRKTVFPSKRPASRWEVVQLARVLDAMVMDAQNESCPPPPSVNASREELARERPEHVFGGLWGVYQGVLHEIVRHVWVQCTERGVLLERVRKSTDLVMAYAGSLLGAYRGHLADSLKQIKQMLERVAENASMRAELVRASAASKATAKEMRHLEHQLQALMLENKALEAKAVASEAQCIDLQADNLQLTQRMQGMEYVNKQLEKQHSSVEQELMGTRAERDRDLELQRRTQDKNMWLEGQQNMVPVLEKDIADLNNVISMLMLGERDAPSKESGCAAGVKLHWMGAESVRGGLRRASRGVGAAMVAGIVRVDTEAALEHLTSMLGAEDTRTVAAVHLAGMADAFKTQFQTVTQALVAVSMETLCHAVKSLPPLDYDSFMANCDGDTREKIIARVVALYPFLSLPVKVCAGCGADRVADPSLLNPHLAKQIEIKASLRSRRDSPVSSRNPLDLLNMNQAMPPGKAEEPAVPEGFQMRALVPVYVSVRSGRSVTAVNGFKDFDAHTGCMEHIAMLQLHRTTLQRKFEGIYPLDIPASVKRLHHDLDRCGLDDVVVLTCFGWKLMKPSKELMGLMASLRGPWLIKSLDNALAGKKASFCFVCCPGERRLAPPTHVFVDEGTLTWQGAFFFSPITNKYEHVCKTRLVMPPGVEELLKRAQCPEHSDLEYELELVKGLLAACSPLLKRIFQFYCFSGKGKGTGAEGGPDPFTLGNKQLASLISDAKCKVSSKVVEQAFRAARRMGEVPTCQRLFINNRVLNYFMDQFIF